MRGILTKMFITLLLFVAIIYSSAWAGSEQVTIIYSNNINGQIDPVG
jgi:archaellum component FlaF (FlaF/FlaG flagellin family)